MNVIVFQVKKANHTRETAKPQTVAIISLWFHVVSDWLLRNGNRQNQIKMFMDYGFAQ